MNLAKPRILFFGYSEVGFDCLSLLLERGDNVIALITHEDNPQEKIWFKKRSSPCTHDVTRTIRPGS